MAKVIAIQCAYCGRDLKVVAQFAGKRIKCPTCGQPISVPGGPPAPAASRKPQAAQSRPSKSVGDRDKKQTSPSAAFGTSAPTTPPARRKRPVPKEEVLDEVEFLDDDEDAYEDYGDVETADDDFGDDDWGDDFGDDDWDDRPRTSKRRTAGKSRGGRTSSGRGRKKKGRHKQDTGFGGTNAGVLGGILMIVVAVIWFFGGLAAGVIFIYPPILLIIGIVAIIRGVMS